MPLYYPCSSALICRALCMVLRRRLQTSSRLPDNRKMDILDPSFHIFSVISLYTDFLNWCKHPLMSHSLCMAYLYTLLNNIETRACDQNCCLVKCRSSSPPSTVLRWTSTVYRTWRRFLLVLTMNVGWSRGIVAQREFCTRWYVASCYESKVGLVHLGTTVGNLLS